MGKSKRKGEESLQLQYGLQIQKASKFYKKEGVLHCWNGHCFQVVDAEQVELDAFKWLAAQFPERATPETARSCSATAKMMAPPVPPRDHQRLIIPLLNAYLEVKSDGKTERHTPDKSFGMTYALKISLPTGGKTYQPGSLPAGSMLDKYFSSSLPDADVRNYLQEFAGNTLTPSTDLQIAILLKGSGSNGKSVLIKLLSALHNPVAAMRLDQLSDFYLMPLIGASLVVVDEVPKAGINEQTLKSLISGEEITINRKHRDPINYKPTAKWIISTNNDQKSSDNSHGFWRRLAIIPFSQQVSGKQVIYGLDQAIIQNELHFFLDWCLEGLQRLKKRGGPPPEPRAVVLAKRDAFEASNSVAAWDHEEELSIVTDALLDKDTVYERYRSWCNQQGLRALSGGQFWKALKTQHPGIHEEQRRISGGKRRRFVNLHFGNDFSPGVGPHPFTE